MLRAALGGHWREPGGLGRGQSLLTLQSEQAPLLAAGYFRERQEGKSLIVRYKHAAQIAED